MSTRDDLAHVPVREEWESLRRAFASEVEKGFSSVMDPGQQHYPHQFAFALGRLDEGLSLVRYFEVSELRSKGGGLDALDLGCGNGGVAFAFANCLKYRVYALDLGPNPVLRRFVHARGMPVRHTLGSGHDLPFRDASFDLILLVDAIEHVASRSRLGEEIMRVLRPGGICFVSTAARLRYLLQPDPHYGVRGLVALPNGLQRFLVNRVWRRRIRDAAGRAVPAYDVEHTFWSVSEIGRLFPGSARVEGVYAEALVSEAPRFSKQWWRWRAKDFLFDHVLIFKAPGS